MRRSPADRPVVAVKSLLAGVGAEPRGWLTRNVDFDQPGPLPGGSEENMPTSQAKPFDIPKQLVWEAYRRVAANKGAPGVDEADHRRVRGRSEEQPLQDLEPDELGVVLPAPGQGGGDTQAPWRGVRVLGVPTVADRVAQTVVAMYLEERAEPRFHPDSYGYRPRQVRPRCGRGMPAAVLEATTGSSISMSRSSSTPCPGTSS